MTTFNKDPVLVAFEKAIIKGEVQLDSSSIEGFFTFNGNAIHNPYLDDFSVDAVVPEDYYGELYLNWFNGLQDELFSELTKMAADDSYASDQFNTVLTETGLFEMYEEDHGSYDKYNDDEGWSNALFHYFAGDQEDKDNWQEWIEHVIEKEMVRLNPAAPVAMPKP